MQPLLLYRELAAWYRLVDDPVEDHRDEAASYQAALDCKVALPLT